MFLHHLEIDPSFRMFPVFGSFTETVMMLESIRSDVRSEVVKFLSEENVVDRLVCVDHPEFRLEIFNVVNHSS